MNYHYNSIEKEAIAEFRDRGSRFLAYAYPLKNKETFKEILAALKKEHPKAVHHCFAYRLGTTGTAFRSSDDGEPSGTAGKPILGQIDSRQLTDVLVLVVRYFGGTLLGVPGLINAYRTAAAMALEKIPIVEKPILVMHTLEFDYTIMNEIMRVTRQFHCQVIEQDLQLFCKMKLGIPLEYEKQCLKAFGEIRSLEISRSAD